MSQKVNETLSKQMDATHDLEALLNKAEQTANMKDDTSPKPLPRPGSTLWRP